MYLDNKIACRVDFRNVDFKILPQRSPPDANKFRYASALKTKKSA